MRVIIALLVAATLFLPGARASAALIADLGVIGVPASPSFGPVNRGSVVFQDDLEFQVSGPGSLDLTGSWTTIAGLGGVEGQMNLVWLLEGVVPVQVATLDQTANTYMLSYANLLPGLDYTIQFFGFGAVGGSLTYGGTVAVVPLPPALILLASAILALTLWGRIRPS